MFFSMDFRDRNVMTLHFQAMSSSIQMWLHKDSCGLCVCVCVCVCVCIIYVCPLSNLWKPHAVCQTSNTELCCLLILHNPVFTNNT